ncbi:aspartate/glutamate racemase family protein [Yoonia sp.]|uniref:aspartate/glutamate racemase family protein n=1 Tax=Yoonia sp. TaxID=2212373 RepID=UPI0025F1DBEA|nr:aspartate/glutamate racemase family protein [Yoonia sp.]
MIIIINPNSTASMTDAMVQTARDACPGVAITGWTSHDGPPAIQGPADGIACVPPLLKLVAQASHQGARVIIIGCFDDTGLDAARAMATCPVIGIGQAAYHLAALAGARFSVVTTLDVSIPVLHENIQAYGLARSLGRVRASGVPVLALDTDADTANARIIAEIKRAVAEDNVQTVVLGCAGMTHIPAAAGPRIGVRLIDGVRAAVQIGAIL